jgi:endo-1,4-beta-xylanase
MPNPNCILRACLAVVITLSVISVPAHGQKKKSKPKRKPFQWVNELKQDLPGVTHATFHSPSMNVDVGYCIYLPPQYRAAKNKTARFPVVYYLHGGRPGSETKSVKLVQYIDKQISAGKVDPMIYVFVNGGPVSHYNMPDRKNAMGEDIFVKELIPHIDATYRTIAERKGRGIEGFSQGGRGTTRIMFKHPELFCSAAPGGAGHATEKRISENDGRESENLVFVKGDNTYDLARKYASHPEPPLPILIHVGTKGFNYENNLAYMKFLKSLNIPFKALIVPDVPHSAMQIYQKEGLKLMRFHADNFRQAAQKTSS